MGPRTASSTPPRRTGIARGIGDARHASRQFASIRDLARALRRGRTLVRGRMTCMYELRLGWPPTSAAEAGTYPGPQTLAPKLTRSGQKQRKGGGQTSPEVRCGGHANGLARRSRRTTHSTPRAAWLDVARMSLGGNAHTAPRAIAIAIQSLFPRGALAAYGSPGWFLAPGAWERARRRALVRGPSGPRACVMQVRGAQRGDGGRAGVSGHIVGAACRYLGRARGGEDEMRTGKARGKGRIYSAARNVIHAASSGDEDTSARYLDPRSAPPPLLWPAHREGTGHGSAFCK